MKLFSGLKNYRWVWVILLLSNHPAVLAKPFTLYLVRHAEKQQSLTHKNPALSACGQARAKALAAELAEQAFSRIYSTDYLRTRQTATPLAEQYGLSITLYDPKKLSEFAAQLRSAGETALVVGHSNTTPQLASLLSGRAQAELTEQDYGFIYQIQLHPDPLIPPTIAVRRQAFFCSATATEVQ